MPGIDPALLRVKDEEWAYLQAIIAAYVRWLTRIRNDWDEPVAEEHATIPALGEALLAGLQRTSIYGRPGPKIQPIDVLPFTMQTTVISAQTVREAVARTLPNLDFYQLDSQYWACNQQDFMRFLAYDWTNTFRQYAAERFDCDDFARYLVARCLQHGLTSVGLVVDWSSRHAYNFVVFADGSASIWEPQTDQVCQPGTGIYKAENGFVVL